MRAQRPVQVVLLGALLAMAVAGPAGADGSEASGGSAGAYVDGAGNPTAEASDTSSMPGAPGAATDCHWKLLGTDETMNVFDDNGKPVTSPTGRWLQKVCNGSPVAVGGVFAIPEQPVDPRDVARRARQSVSIPEPVLSTSPPADHRLYAQMPTWLFLDQSWWKPYSATADTGGVSATVVARPVRATWSTGDGRQVVCTGPGVAWHRGLPESATDCSHTYIRSSSGRPGGTFTLGVTVEFAVSWTASTGAGGALPSITRTASRPVEVGEIQAVETG